MMSQHSLTPASAPLTSLGTLTAEGLDDKQSKLKPVSLSTGGKDRDGLILSHLGTVEKLARQVRRRVPNHIELDDLVSAGMLGLLDAAEKFDSTGETPFTSYASFRIRGAMLDSLRGLDWSPRELRRKHNGIKKMREQLTQALGRAPEDTEIAVSLDMSLDGYHQVLADSPSLEVESLDAVRDDEQAQSLLDTLAASAASDPLLLCLQAELKDVLREAIDALPERERLVLTMRYFGELPVRQIAKLLGVVESRVSQIHGAALAMLRQTLGEGWTGRE